MKGVVYRLPTAEECKQCSEIMGNILPCFTLEFCCLKQDFNTEKNDAELFTEYPNACRACGKKDCSSCIMKM